MFVLPIHLIDKSAPLIDFGLVVLIWLVQLIIYPSFNSIRAEVFQDWHRRYTFNISMVVVPLMLAQGLLVAMQLYTTPDVSNTLSAILLVAIWISTFYRVVPVHNALAAGHNLTLNAQKLVARNWLRTILWTVLFALNFTR